MFKKLKDKIAEEVKQSPLKSVQQLASAVVSPSSSSVFEPSSNDHFCIDDDDEDNQDTPKNSPAKAGGFTTVNLHGQTATAAATASPLDASFLHDISSRSRKSSISSVASDASAFFPRYEPSSHSFHLQSDLESASEVEDSLNVQLERVSKENLYEAYRKLRMRYNKYKGRFVDLAEHYRRLEKENTKCKNILLDTQDKALRRFSELREQCALEQEAKAHLEEALRSDLEEKDHLIRTLNTKIELLKKADVVETPASEPKNLMDFTVTSSVLEDKVKNLELMLEQSRVSILEKNEIIGKHQNELASTKNLYSQKLSSLTKDLNEAKDQIEQLQNTVSLMKKNEEESALSLAENKLTVHKELEMRDEQLKRYKTSVEDLTKEKDDLNNKVIQLQNDLSALNGSNRVIDEEKTDLQELSRGKSEAVKLMQQKLVSNEKVYNEKLSTKESEISRLMIENANLIEKLKKFEEHSSEFESDTRTGEQLNEKEEIKKLKNHIEILEEKLRSSLVERDELIVKISKCEEEIENLEEDKKSILEQKNLEIKNLELLVDNHKTENEKLSTKIECLDNEIQSNKRKEEKDLERLKYEQDSQMNELKSLYNSKNEELSNTIKSISNLEKDLIESQELKERLLQQLSSANVDLKSKDCVIECQKKSIDNFQSEIQQLNSKITSIDKLYNECQKEKAILEQKLSSEDLLRAEIIEKLKEDKFSVEKQLKDSENRIVRLENDLKSKESMLGEKNEENNKHHKTLEDLEKNIELLEEEIIEQKQKLEEYSHLDSELERLRKLISTFKSLLNRPCESADNGSNKNKTLSNHKSIISNIEEEGKILIEDIKCLQSQLKEKEERLEKMTLEIEESKSAMKNLVSQLSQNHVANNLSKEEILKHLHVNRNMLNAMKDHYNKFASETKSDLGTAYNSLQSVADNFAFLKCQITKNEELTTTRVEELEKTISSSISLHSEEKSGLYENLSSLESEMLVMKGNCQDLKSKLDVETNKCQNHEEKLGRFQELLEEKTKENNELKIVLSELEKKKDIVSQTLSESKEKMNRLESELLDKDNQLKTLLNQAKLHEEENVQTLKNGLRFLENEISNMKIEFDGELARKDQILLTKESECRKIKNDVEEKVLQQNILLEDKQHAIDVFTSDLDRLKGVILSELSSIDFQQESLVRQKGKPFISDENLNPEAKSKDSYHVQSVSLKGLESEVLRLLMIIKQNSRTFSDIKNNVIRLDSELGTLIRKYFKNMKEPNSCLEEKLFEGFSNSFSNAFSQVDILSNLLSTKEEVILNLESNSELLLSKNSELEAKYESMKAENSKIIAEIDAVKQNSNKGSVSNSVKLSNATSQLESARQEYVELQAIHNGKCAELSKLSEELSSLKKESDSLRERLEMKDNASQEVNKLASENEDLKLKIEAIEEDRNRSLKQLILEFNTKIAEKDEEIRAAEFKKFDRKEAEDNFLFVELKQQIKDLNSQLESSCESYEGKLADSKRSKEELEKNMEEIKNNHEKQMRDQDKKWRACLDRRLLEAERKYKEEIDELSKEWQNERKKNDLRNTEQIQSQELENSSRLAVAAMESGAGSSELLRKQVTSLTKQLEDLKLQHKREMSELQKYLAMKKHSKDKQNDITIDDCTEMEYLRNILFEYMMGKEPVIMAKVLSAIVKFDPEQTNKILQKEEQKVSLLRKVVNH